MLAPEDLTFKVKNASVLNHAAKAIRVKAPSLKQPAWIPHSIVCDESEVHCLGTTGNLIIKAWWARKQGWW